MIYNSCQDTAIARTILNRGKFQCLILSNLPHCVYTSESNCNIYGGDLGVMTVWCSQSKLMTKGWWMSVSWGLPNLWNSPKKIVWHVALNETSVCGKSSRHVANSLTVKVILVILLKDKCMLRLLQFIIFKLWLITGTSWVFWLKSLMIRQHDEPLWRAHTANPLVWT